MHQNIDHLSEMGRDLFNQYVPEIFKAPAQIRMLIVALETLDFRETIKAEIQATGLTTTTPTGITRSNPLLVDLQKCESAFTRLCQQLGLGKSFTTSFDTDSMDHMYHSINYPGYV